MSIRTVLCVALLSAPVAAAPVTESWSGELGLITIDNPPNLFAGFPLGTPVSGSLDYDDACPSAECMVNPDDTVAIYTFPSGTADLSFGSVDVAHSPAAPSHDMKLVISNDAPLIPTTANALTELLNMTIELGTPVDSWVLTSFQEDESGTRTQFGIFYTSLDTTLYDDTSFRGPPDPSEVYGVTFGVGEGLFGSSYFGSGLVDAPEPGAPALLAVGALILGLARRLTRRSIIRENSSGVGLRMAQPNKPLQLTGYSESRLHRVALGKGSGCRRGTFRRPAAERHIR